MKFIKPYDALNQFYTPSHGLFFRIIERSFAPGPALPMIIYPYFKYSSSLFQSCAIVALCEAVFLLLYFRSCCQYASPIASSAIEVV